VALGQSYGQEDPVINAINNTILGIVIQLNSCIIYIALDGPWYDMTIFVSGTCGEQQFQILFRAEPYCHVLRPGHSIA
jgi:hypothetical protein